jgi:uncharacterized protein
MAAHLGVLVSAAVAMAFLAPLIVLLLVGKRSTFVRRHATESLNFQLTVLIYLAIALVVGALAFRSGGLLLLVPVVGLGAALALVAVIFATLAASRGEDFRYPLTFRFIKS